MIKPKPIPVLLYSFSIFLVGTMIVFADLELAPVDVLQDWKLTVSTNKTYYPGSTISLSSSYKKVRQVTGQATRYIQCRKPNSNEWDGFIPVSESDANRPKTSQGSSITYIGIPSSLPSLPNTCRIYINVNYRINYLRSFTEQNYSNEFTVNPTPQQVQNGITLNSQNANEELAPNTVSNPATLPDKSEPSSAQIQANNPMVSPENAPATSNNSIVTAPVRGLTAALGGLVSGLRALAGL